MPIDAKDVARLREETGAAMMDRLGDLPILSVELVAFTSTMRACK